MTKWQKNVLRKLKKHNQGVNNNMRYDDYSIEISLGFFIGVPLTISIVDGSDFLRWYDFFWLLWIVSICVGIILIVISILISERWEKMISAIKNRNSSKERKETSPRNFIQLDLASFYRSLLGLKLNFTHAELKKSYHEAVGKYHPDRYCNSSSRDRKNAEVLMKQVNEAYKNLKEFAE